MPPPRNTASPICYLEIPAPDLKKAAAFYRALFGWKIQPSGNYLIFSTSKEGLSGGLDPRKGVAAEGVLIYLKVKAIPAMLTKIQKAGGRVIQKRKEVGPGWGYFAIFQDPNGNRIGLWSKT